MGEDAGMKQSFFGTIRVRAVPVVFQLFCANTLRFARQDRDRFK